MNLKIHRAENSFDLENCLNIRNQVFTIEKGVPKDIEVDGFDVLDSLCDHFLILNDSKPCGALRCMNVDEESVQVQRFCILKDFRNLGIGKVAMGFLEDYYKRKGKSKIQMDSKYSVYKFYEKCGYVKISDIFTEANVDHVKMVKNI